MEKILKILLQVLHGTGTEYIWEETEKISNISSEETGKSVANNENKTIEKEFDWTKLYGELESRRI